jgi:hypothetical protein
VSGCWSTGFCSLVPGTVLCGAANACSLEGFQPPGMQLDKPKIMSRSVLCTHDFLLQYVLNGSSRAVVPLVSIDQLVASLVAYVNTYHSIHK